MSFAEASVLALCVLIAIAASTGSALALLRLMEKKARPQRVLPAVSSCQREAVSSQFGKVFISHNSVDKDTIQEIDSLLRLRGVDTWLDEKDLKPGDQWSPEIERALLACNAAIVCVGSNEISPWVQAELQGLVKRSIARNARIPLIPVLLPGGPSADELPVFLGMFAAVDFRNGINEQEIRKLMWGVTGHKP